MVEGVGGSGVLGNSVTVACEGGQHMPSAVCSGRPCAQVDLALMEPKVQSQGCKTVASTCLPACLCPQCSLSGIWSCRTLTSSLAVSWYAPGTDHQQSQFGWDWDETLLCLGASLAAPPPPQSSPGWVECMSPSLSPCGKWILLPPFLCLLFQFPLRLMEMFS